MEPGTKESYLKPRTGQGVPEHQDEPSRSYYLLLRRVFPRTSGRIPRTVQGETQRTRFHHDRSGRARRDEGLQQGRPEVHQGRKLRRYHSHRNLRKLDSLFPLPGRIKDAEGADGAPLRVERRAYNSPHPDGFLGHGRSLLLPGGFQHLRYAVPAGSVEKAIERASDGQEIRKEYDVVNSLLEGLPKIDLSLERLADQDSLKIIDVMLQLFAAKSGLECE